MVARCAGVMEGRAAHGPPQVMKKSALVNAGMPVSVAMCTGPAPVLPAAS
jgi:hypothetical protein